MDDGVVHHVGEAGCGVAARSGAGGISGEPLDGPLGRAVDIRRVGPQSFPGRCDDDLPDPLLLGGGDYVAGAQHVGSHRAVDLALSESRIALGGQVEHHVGAEAPERRYDRPPVPDVEVEILSGGQQWPLAGEPPADAG